MNETERRKWVLQFRQGGEDWADVGAYLTGDSAKTNARQHQIGKGVAYLYRILSPDGKPWIYGKATHTARGLRMLWA